MEAANRIVDRVVAGHPKKGLIWHFQGSGKSLLMLFAARKLRLHPALGNPTVIIVVDRIDLDTQISSTFHAADAPNLEKADSRADLERLLAQDARKIIITTIFKFGEVDGVLNDRQNIIVLVDEAHRSQEGDVGPKMRRALPNAFLFGLTGTPINRADRNTFFAFGAEEDEYGYLSRNGFEESIRDGATKPLHFEPRLPELHVDRDAIDAECQELTGGLSDLDREQLSKTAARTAVLLLLLLLLLLLKTPERICADVAKHFQKKVAPHGFGAQVDAYDRESCVIYEKALDRVLSEEMSEVVMTVNSGEDEYAAYHRDRDAEERLLHRFRDPNDPLKILIVTSKLFDRLRRAHSARDVPRQAAAGPHAATGHLPHEPAVRRDQDARTDRRLPGNLRRRGPGDPVRRGGQHPRRHEHQRACRRAARGRAEVPGVVPRRRPQRDRLRGADRRPGMPPRQCGARRLRRRLRHHPRHSVSEALVPECDQCRSDVIPTPAGGVNPQVNPRPTISTRPTSHLACRSTNVRPFSRASSRCTS